MGAIKSQMFLIFSSKSCSTTQLKVLLKEPVSLNILKSKMKDLDTDSVGCR